MSAPHALPARFAELGVERPPIVFSEALALDLNGDAIHVVHQKPVYCDADAIAHFHLAHLGISELGRPTRAKARCRPFKLKNSRDLRPASENPRNQLKTMRATAAPK
jgi:hypothetical protein